MATIDAKKLLPPSKKAGAIEKQKFLVPLQNISTNRISTRDLRPVDRETSADESLSIIKKKISRLSLLLEESYLIEKKEREARRKAEERRRSEQRERNLERKVKKNKVSPNLISSIPGQSIFDKINRFIGFTLLGYLFNKYGEILPKLLEFGRVLKPVGEFVESFAKNLLKGAIDFVEFGYKAYDQTRDFVKQIGGEGAQKTFDEFSKNLNILLNGAIASAMLIASTSPGKPGRPGRMPGGKPSTLPKNAKLSSYLGRDAQTKLIERRYGNDAARMYEARKSQGASASRARADVLKRFDKFEGPQRGLAGGTGKGSILSRGFGKSANRAALKVLGKTGTKIAKGVFGRVPIIGGLLDFAFSLAMGEDPGRAAAKAVGATVGSALGTFIPIPFAGTILGGILGDIVGGALYDSLAGSKKPEGRAEGGQISGGGQRSVATSRRIKTPTRKTPPRIQPQKTQPGKDVGGKLKIEELYGQDQPGARSALRALKKSSEDVKKIKSINGLVGSMFGAGIDMALGQKPDKNLSRNIGNIFGSVISSAIDMELNKSFGDISKTIAMAGGGVVPSREIGRSLSVGERIGNFISRAFTVSIESSAARILQNLRNEMNLEGGGTGGGSGPDGADPDVDGRGGGAGGGMFTGKAADIPPEGKALLDAIAGSESGGYNSRYPSKTFDNNWVDHPRISERILSGPNKGKTSDAAGRYQFLSTTWDQYKPAKEFTPENQDIAAYRLAIAAYGYGESGLIKDLKNDPLQVANKLSKTWTSLPGGIEPNNATNGFLSRYKDKVKKYQSQGGPTLSAKGVKKFSRSDITSFFKQQESFRSKPHEGMDIAAPQGTAISFGMGGTVLKVWRTNSGARDANGGYGTYMDVKFSDGRIARIAHLSSVPSSIRNGTTFGANQIIAYSGGKPGAPGSGRSGGPHIHMEQLSQPMGSQETTKGKVDPLKGGLFDLIQKGGTKLSLAPSQSSAVASLNRSGVLKEDTSTMIYNNNAIAILPIEVAAGVA